MGKATIISHQGAGLYRVAINYDQAAYATRVAALTATVTELTAQLETLDGQITEAEGTQDAALRALDSAISGGDLTTMQAAEKALMAANAVWGGLKQTRALFTARKVSAEKGLETLQATPPTDRIVDAWCTDLSEELTGSVGTINPAGKDAATVIRSGYEGAASYSAARDGLYKMREHCGPAEVFYNAALLAGWQKWLPTYRIGSITALNGDRCDVALDPVASDAQSIDVNQTETLADVGIDYMDCHGAAFEIGDTVVVMFAGQDWGNPQVIGFEKNPRACAGQYGFIVNYQTTGGAAISGALAYNFSLRCWVFTAGAVQSLAVRKNWNAPGLIVSAIGREIVCNSVVIATLPPPSPGNYQLQADYAWFNAARTELIVLSSVNASRSTFRAPIVPSGNSYRPSGPFVATDDLPFYPHPPAGGHQYFYPADLYVSPDSQLLFSRYECFSLVDSTWQGSHDVVHAQIAAVEFRYDSHGELSDVGGYGSMVETTDLTQLAVFDLTPDVISTQIIKTVNGLNGFGDNSFGSVTKTSDITVGSCTFSSVRGYNVSAGIRIYRPPVLFGGGYFFVASTTPGTPTVVDIDLYFHGEKLFSKQFETLFIGWSSEAWLTALTDWWTPFQFLATGFNWAFYDDRPGIWWGPSDYGGQELLGPLDTQSTEQQYIDGSNYSGESLTQHLLPIGRKPLSPDLSAVSLIEPTGKTQIYLSIRIQINIQDTPGIWHTEYRTMTYLSPGLQEALPDFASILSIDYL